MKGTLMVLFFLMMIKVVFAQEGENPLPYVMPEPKFDTAPQYPCGPEAMMKYFNDSVRYPETERSKKIQGGVSLKFVVTADGSVTKVELINGVPGAPDLAKEAVRLMYSMPRWIPATKNGQPVEAEYYLSIPFKQK